MDDPLVLRVSVAASNGTVSSRWSRLSGPLQPQLAPPAASVDADGDTPSLLVNPGYLRPGNLYTYRFAAADASGETVVDFSFATSPAPGSARGEHAASRRRPNTARACCFLLSCFLDLRGMARRASPFSLGSCSHTRAASPPLSSPLLCAVTLAVIDVSPARGNATSTVFSATVSGVIVPPDRFPGDAGPLFEFSYDVPGPGAAAPVVVRGFAPSPTASFVLPPGSLTARGVVRIRARVRSADGTLSSGYAETNVTVQQGQELSSLADIAAAAQRARLAVRQGSVDQGMALAAAITAVLPATGAPAAQAAVVALRQQLLEIVSDAVTVALPSQSMAEMAARAVNGIVTTSTLSPLSQTSALMALSDIARLGDLVSPAAASNVLNSLSALASMCASAALPGVTGRNLAVPPFAPPGYAPPPRPPPPLLPAAQRVTLPPPPPADLANGGGFSAADRLFFIASAADDLANSLMESLTPGQAPAVVLSPLLRISAQVDFAPSARLATQRLAAVVAGGNASQQGAFDPLPPAALAAAAPGSILRTTLVGSAFDFHTNELPQGSLPRDGAAAGVTRLVIADGNKHPYNVSGLAQPVTFTLPAPPQGATPDDRSVCSFWCVRGGGRADRLPISQSPPFVLPALLDAISCASSQGHGGEALQHAGLRQPCRPRPSRPHGLLARGAHRGERHRPPHVVGRLRRGDVRARAAACDGGDDNLLQRHPAQLRGPGSHGLPRHDAAALAAAGRVPGGRAEGPGAGSVQRARLRHAGHDAAVLLECDQAAL